MELHTAKYVREARKYKLQLLLLLLQIFPKVVGAGTRRGGNSYPASTANDPLSQAIVQKISKKHFNTFKNTDSCPV